MRNRRVRILIGVAVIGGCAAVVLWCLTLMRPTWWRPPNAFDSSVRELADDFEYRLLEEAQRSRSNDQTWAIRIDEDQINAWLATRLRSWIDHDQHLEWPEDWGTPQVHITDGAIQLGLQLERAFRPVVGATFRPSVEDRRLRIELDRVWGGRLALPGRPVGTLLNRIEDDQSDTFLSEDDVRAFIDLCLYGGDVESSVSLADDRRVELLDLECREGSIILHCRTAPARSPNGTEPIGDANPEE